MKKDKLRKTFHLAAFIAFATLASLCTAGAFASDAAGLRSRITDTAKKHLGARYNYGGVGRSGFDCSGFVQHVFHENGIELPRSTPDQFAGGKKIELYDVQPGDLVFFRICGGRISHVGIFVAQTTFIHAPSSGKRVSFADMNLEYWKKRFAGAVTYIGQDRNRTPAGAPEKK
ncbi:MAG: C40 family peptidase [Spirochaetes bacterium]|nr:C40 family peptidase [Spirochaetota bacterium]